jgi:hypothetical protein
MTAVTSQTELRHRHPPPFGDTAIGEIGKLHSLRPFHKIGAIGRILGDMTQERLPALPEGIGSRQGVRNLLPLRGKFVAAGRPPPKNASGVFTEAAEASATAARTANTIREDLAVIRQGCISLRLVLPVIVEAGTGQIRVRNLEATNAEEDTTRIGRD